ncbi:hypothetical protein Tco_0203913, partial [Tanacetum coccineum]
VTRVAYVEVCQATSGKLRNPRDTYGVLRNALQPKISGGKGDEAWILLVYHAQRRKGGNPKVRLMPNSRSGAQVAKNLNDIHHGPMAILSMGYGHPRAPSTGSWEGQICNCGY